MHTLVFLDLDDTLFQSLQKCPIEKALHPVAYLRDRSANSFMTAQQQMLWQLLDDNTIIIPTTARDRDALHRVKLPFRSWCILNYGGVILTPAGSPDSYWHQQMITASKAAINDLHVVLELINTAIVRQKLAVQARLITDFNLPFYIVVKYHSGHVADLDQLQQTVVAPWVESRHLDYQLHRNSNNLAVLPRSLGKEHAVHYLIKKLSNEWGELLTIGIGDSLIDKAFMAECDYSITPRGSQLFKATLGRPLNNVTN
ncbi:haloacid dehalogenase [Chromatium weissei]|nr:haloacid dehalogenase [Chromatium weissei]